MDYKIRIATADDAEFLTRHRIAFIRLLGYNVPKEKEKEVFERLKAQIGRKINNTLLCVVAEVEGELAGTAYMTIDEGLYHPDTPNGITGHVVNVHTVEKFRGNGIASSMIEKVIEYSREHGVEKIILDATDKGKPVYERLGFKSDVDPIIPTAMYYLIKD